MLSAWCAELSFAPRESPTAEMPIDTVTGKELSPILSDIIFFCISKSFFICSTRLLFEKTATYLSREYSRMKPFMLAAQSRRIFSASAEAER
jgi:hypothetical protein